MDKAVTKEEQKTNYEQESIPVSTLTDDVPRLTAVQAKALMGFLKRMFAVVHLVNPHRCEQYTVDSEGKVRKIEHRCFDEWGKGHCCENCVSATVLRTHRPMTKVEFVDNRLYGITSSKIIVDDAEYVLELASYADCETDSTGDDGGILEAITEHNKRLYIDSVTGVYNRRYFDDVIGGLEGTYSFAMLDMDNFKQINDSFGHAAGDAALAAVAGVLKECVADSGEVIRYGGDEFFMLFDNMRGSDMKKMLAEILKRVEDVRLDEYPELKMTISIGGATAKGKLSRSIRKADVAMYRAKNIRNSIEMYGD